MIGNQTFRAWIPVLIGFLLLLPGLVEAALPGSNVAFGDALKEARALIANESGWHVLKTEGVSMQPLFSSGALLVVQEGTVAEARLGMLVVYRDAAGDRVAHQVVAVEGNAVYAKGLRNFSQDPDPVTPQNILGYVVGMLLTQGDSAGHDVEVAWGKTY